MEEKERYEYFFGTNTIKDNKTNQFYGCVVDLLNQQDKRIKELENENKQLKQQVEFYKEENKINKKDCDYYFDEYTLCKRKIKDLEQEKQQLKQQLHDLPKKIVEEIRIELNNIVEVGDYFDTETDEETNLLKQSDIENILDTILKKFGEKNESNND